MTRGIKAITPRQALILSVITLQCQSYKTLARRCGIPIKIMLRECDKLKDKNLILKAGSKEYPGYKLLDYELMNNYLANRWGHLGTPKPTYY